MGVALFEILQHEGPDVVGTNFGKPIGGGIFEFRLDQNGTEILHRKGKQARPETSPPAKILLRVSCHAHGDKIVLLLAGYDKGEHTSRRAVCGVIDIMCYSPYPSGHGHQVQRVHARAATRGEG